MSQLEVNKIIPQSGTTLTIGDSGDTISFASGVLPALESLTITGDLTVDTTTLKVDSTNNFVGIGTASPVAKLHIQATAATSGEDLIKLSNGADAAELIIDTSANAINFKTGTSDDIVFLPAGSEAMRIDSSGNVGIGTSSPNYVLDIQKDGGGSTIRERIRNTGTLATDSAVLQLQIGGTTSESLIYFGDSADSNVGQIRYDHATDFMSLTTNASEAMRIDSSGNVGIGTTSPAALLDVNGGLNCGFLQSSSSIYATSGVFRSSDGSASVPSIQPGVDNDTGFFRPTTNTIGFSTAATERMRITSAGNVGIGTSSPSTQLEVVGTIQITNTVNASNNSNIRDGGGLVIESGNSNPMYFYTGGSERMRINSSGAVLINTTTENLTGGVNYLTASVTGLANEDGWGLNSSAIMYQQTNATVGFYMNDSSSTAGTHNYILFRFQGGTIGDIDTTDNTTIRYNTFTGAHWSQFHDGTNPELKKGTVMSLTGDKLEYSKCEKTITKEDGTETIQKYEIAGTHTIGSEVTVPNDEYGEENSTTTATVVSNYIADHLVKVKVSDSVADKAVYGVWAGKYSDGDLSVEALGTSKIRIKQGEVLEVGDLLESAGDGTAQKQSDGIIKNSTIAKVTSPIVIETFDDNSFLVSCVLYCG